MPILTATEVTVYSTISASAGTITNSGLIPIIQERISMMTNNYFTTDLYIQGLMTFNTVSGTITCEEDSFSDQGFIDNDDIFIYNSYRNDGYFTAADVDDDELTIPSSQSVTEELSGRSIIISVVKWPLDVKVIAARMIAYDYDQRGKVSANLKSRSLGPWSESYKSGTENIFGYPAEIVDDLSSYRIARFM